MGSCSNLKSSLDEHNLELRVKTANEAEVISQQRLAAAEADIAELRQKLEASKRDDIKILRDIEQYYSTQIVQNAYECC
ncbi:hypothetical protein CMV_027316 [Castanea mollissima]|uniref:E3 ubiquitin protein ligase n=1 Tax=Castanea mollissima TaxID=60419 RepID=A0A8J4Q9V6_9ROSI|nr:hypothetical protein CMV_027316 [Castanea mollissima]